MKRQFEAYYRPENVHEQSGNRYEKNEPHNPDDFVEAFKLCPLIAKLKPVYQNHAPKFLQRAIALFLCLGLAVPVYASDLITTTDTGFQPVVAVEDTTTVEESTLETESPDAFINDGALSTATVSETTGKMLYVSNSGSDTGDGSEGSAWKSLSYAVSQLKAGDTLNIMAGTYKQPGSGAVLKASGTSDAYITIQGIGDVIIEGTATTTIGGYEVASNYSPAFDTKGFDYIKFKNLTVNNLRAAVEVSPGSSYIEINGLKANRNHFAVKINGGDHVTVKNVVAVDSRNGFRTENTAGIVPSDILFENIEVYGSKDVHSTFESKYRNGDGFILEAGNKITIRNVKSYDNWDAGFDIKAVNVLIENVEVYGNKNNFKIWGSGIIVKNALSRNAKIMVDDPVAGEGYGVNARMGQVTFINSTFVDNENRDIRVDNAGGPANVTFQNSIIARSLSTGEMFKNDGGTFTDKNNIWYWTNHSSPGLTINSSSRYVDPKFVKWGAKDFRLQSTSPAVNFGVTVSATTFDLDGNPRIVDGVIDAGAYEYQGSSLPDTTAPVINGVTSSNVTSTRATIQWSTSEPADSQVEYRVKGATTWQATSISALLVTNHSVVLSGLSSEQEYEFRVKSKDAAGNLATQTTISGFTTLAANTGTNPAPFEMVDGQVVMEGESFFGSTTVNDQSWEIVDVPGNISSSSGKALMAGPDLGRNINDISQSPRADFQINVPAPGTYYVWVHGYAKDGGSDSLHVGLNGVLVDGGYQMARFTFDGSASSWSNRNMSGTRVSFTVSEAGEHTLNLWMREDGLLVNKIVISQDAAYVPTGVGPAESERVVTDITAPVISAVAASNITASGVTINWTTDETSDSQVEYRVQGSTTWSATPVNSTMVTNHSVTLSGLNASTEYEFRVKSKDAAGNTATQATVSTFTTQSTGTEPPVTTCTTAMCGVTSGQTVSGVIKVQPNLTLNPDIKKVAYYLNKTSSGKEYTAPFTWGGTAGFDTTKLADGNYTLAGAYTTGAGDQNFSISFVVKNNTTAPVSDTTAPVISAVTASNITASGATINWTTNEASDSQVEYRVQGSTTWTAAPVNSTMVTNHSVTLSGLNASTAYEFRVKSKDAAGNMATQATVSTFTTLSSVVTCTTAMCGVTSGQTVSGVIKVQPNLTLNPDIKKVAYYLNKTSSGKEYTAPFTWGGSAGFDTKKLANGTYVLSGAYTTAAGDVSFTISFTVNN